MHDTLLLSILCSLAGLGAAFLAGLKWRDRRHEREMDVADLAICQLDERVGKLEQVLCLSTDQAA